MYENDSFLTLTVAERIGLVCVTLLLSAALIWLFWVAIKRVNIWVRPLLALVFLYVFIWLSPQIYYLYYLVIFDFLDFKNVIHPPFNPLTLFNLLTFTESGKLADHGKGVLGWILIALSFLHLRKTS
ncbi:MAG: hypothetical protein ABJO86_06835 [Lentilitoribacter sp.]